MKNICFKKIMSLLLCLMLLLGTFPVSAMAEEPAASEIPPVQEPAPEAPVDEPIPEEELEPEEEKEKMSAGTLVLIALCAALAVGLVIQGVILTGKLHRLEEERL